MMSEPLLPKNKGQHLDFHAVNLAARRLFHAKIILTAMRIVFIVP
jgi:hypothetical protein